MKPKWLGYLKEMFLDNEHYEILNSRIEITFFNLLVINIPIYLTWSKCNNFRRLGNGIEDLKNTFHEYGYDIYHIGMKWLNSNYLSHYSQSRRDCLVVINRKYHDTLSLPSGRVAGNSLKCQATHHYYPEKCRPIEKL